VLLCRHKISFSSSRSQTNSSINYLLAFTLPGRHQLTHSTMFCSLIGLALMLQQQGRSHLVKAGPIPGAVTSLVASHDGTHAPQGLVADSLETKAPVAGRHGGGDGSAFESEEAVLADFAKYVTGGVGGLMDTKEDGAKIGLRGTESGTTGGVHPRIGDSPEKICVDGGGLPGGAKCGVDAGLGSSDSGCFKNKRNAGSCASGYRSSDCCQPNNCIRNENNGGFSGDDDYYCSESPPSPSPTLSPTQKPTRRPTRSPTRSPTRQPHSLEEICVDGGGLLGGALCGIDAGFGSSDSGCFKNKRNAGVCASGYSSSDCCGPNNCIRNENNGGFTGHDEYYCSE